MFNEERDLKELLCIFKQFTAYYIGFYIILIIFFGYRKKYQLFTPKKKKEGKKKITAAL